MTETERCLLLAFAAVDDAEQASEWFDTDLDLWLTDVRRFIGAALARARELRDIDELEAAMS